MLKKLITISSLACAFSFAQLAHAQADPTATALSNLQIGGGYTYARTDYGQRGDQGLTFFGDYDLGVHWGGEAEFHYTSLSTPDSVSENSFLAGPRFIYRKRHFKLYGKAMLGLGHISVPYTDTNHLVAAESDFVYGVGVGAEYLVGRHLTIRPIDFEYQRWSFRTGLTPAVLTTGVAYRFH